VLLEDYGDFMSIKLRETCRVCGSKNLVPILSLGEQYSVGFMDKPDEFTVKAPLDLVLCNVKNGGCGLLQLKHTLDHDILYRKYWYKSGISTTMVKALKDIVDAAGKIIKLKQGDIVIDIGSNDGTLLKQFSTKGIIKVGFEPSNLWELGVSEDTKIIHDYFNYSSFRKEFGDKKSKLITSISMFYDLEDPNTFVDDIKQCLDKDGLWIIQMNYLGLMLQENTFDNISHEHLEYYSLLSLKNLLDRHDMETMDVELNDVNGGGFRIYVRHKNSKVKPFAGGAQRVNELLNNELKQGFDDKKVYDAFSKRISSIKVKLLEFLKQETKSGKRVYIYGASTRGLVVLQYAGITNKLIPFAIDRNEDKWGKYIVGTGIKVIPFEDYRKNPPDYLLVLPYQFKNEIAKQEADFLKQGGKMIFALPNFQVIDKNYLKE
jgi:hypothetical protein